MSGKIATEKELFTLGGGKETDKPSNYDINRCVTKTRSTAFKSVTANLTSYKNLQLIPVSLFGKIVMADTIQIEIGYNLDSNKTVPEFDIVLLVDGKEIHYTDIPNGYGKDYTMFKTYEWVYDESFITKEERENINDKKEIAIQNINLKKVKELMGNHNNATIQFKAKWYDTIPQDPTIKYTVKLLANEEERYKAQNTVRLLTHEWFPVDVFFRKLFEITYDSENDLISVLNNSDPEKTATFEYDLVISKNYNILVQQHMVTNSSPSILTLAAKDFNLNDKFTLEIANFTIKLSMSNGTIDTIIPNFKETKISSKIKNECKLSILRDNINYYILQVDVLKDISIFPGRTIFGKNDLTFGDFNPFEHAFMIQMLSILDKSDFIYYDTSDNIKGIQQTIDIF